MSILNDIRSLMNDSPRQFKRTTSINNIVNRSLTYKRENNPDQVLICIRNDKGSLDAVAITYNENPFDVGVYFGQLSLIDFQTLLNSNALKEWARPQGLIIYGLDPTFIKKHEIKVKMIEAFD